MILPPVQRLQLISQDLLTVNVKTVASAFNVPSYLFPRSKQFRTEVPNLGYMYPTGYNCLSVGVHSMLAIENKIYLSLFITIYLHIYQ